MTNLPINLIISVLLLVGITAGVLFVQVRLSQSKNKYFGLILPGISFIYSLFIVLGMAAFSVTTVTMEEVATVSIEEEIGEIIEESEEIFEESDKITSTREVDSSVANFANLTFIFFITNIPTMVLGGVYVSERNKLTVRKEIEKMKIEDL